LDLSVHDRNIPYYVEKTLKEGKMIPFLYQYVRSDLAARGKMRMIHSKVAIVAIVIFLLAIPVSIMLIIDGISDLKFDPKKEAIQTASPNRFHDFIAVDLNKGEYDVWTDGGTGDISIERSNGTHFERFDGRETFELFSVTRVEGKGTDYIKVGEISIDRKDTYHVDSDMGGTIYFTPRFITKWTWIELITGFVIVCVSPILLLISFIFLILLRVTEIPELFLDERPKVNGCN